MDTENAADRYRLLLKLTPSQALAVEVIDRGGSHSEAAEAAGVDRTTVVRWMRHPAFMAEINRRRLDRARSNERALAEIDRKAMAVVAEAIESEGSDLALRWFKLRGFGGLTKAATGPIDAADIIEGRRRDLPAEALARLGAWSTERAVDALWQEQEGPSGPTDWKQELLLLRADDLAFFSEDGIADLLDQVDLDDPEVAAHVKVLGLAVDGGEHGTDSDDEDGRHRGSSSTTS